MSRKSKISTYKKTKKDFEQDLAEQIYFLQKSVREYDMGNYIEAKQMSVNLRNLLYDTGGLTTSVLTHLGKKNIKFYDTSIKDDPRNLLPLTGLIYYEFQKNPNERPIFIYAPALDVNEPESRSPNRKVDFKDWWDCDIINDKKGNKLTRESLVLTTCQQDGGAHVDAEITENYVKVLKGLFEVGPDPIIHSNIIYASIRQITHEVLKTLNDEFPKYFE